MMHAEHSFERAQCLAYHSCPVIIDVITPNPMQSDSPNPYRSPSGSGGASAPPKAATPSWIGYLASLSLLLVLTALLSPADGGRWLGCAALIELGCYLVFLTVQAFLFRRRKRRWETSSGPKLCFVTSAALVVTWTIALEFGLLPYPP